uniref:Uncharacterized protein TCIL3000_11_11280 n=1 Tax=Trypanosoma congolense (strain IL3000) TaxID=1068625 RepID=G0V1W8_TRYCI|nr:unnamed protein product [Trypanosoma congolense IL3000]
MVRPEWQKEVFSARLACYLWRRAPLAADCCKAVALVLVRSLNTGRGARDKNLYNRLVATVQHLSSKLCFTRNMFSKVLEPDNQREAIIDAAEYSRLYEVLRTVFVVLSAVPHRAVVTHQPVKKLLISSAKPLMTRCGRYQFLAGRNCQILRGNVMDYKERERESDA